jgi:UDP-N-acetylmuramoylalanine--D-glutamate ligase
MNTAILGYGLEGKSAEKYFQKHGDSVKIFDNFKEVDSLAPQLRDFDRVLRSPSVHPKPAEPNWTSVTKYFFQHCPCPIIGVTGTKGKGTTCSIITSLLRAFGKKVHLLGNIGTPALDILDDIDQSDIVVYEMSSFQLWDLDTSPHISVVLRIEPDHLNVHDDFDDYVSAKANIAKHQTPSDTCIYYQNNPDSVKIANQSAGQKIPYPFSPSNPKLEQLLDNLQIPGKHNRENAEAALQAVAAMLSPESTFDDFISTNYDTLSQGLHDFQGLPHRIQFLRELNGVRYYDDNYSTVYPSLDVAIETFKNIPTILIAGGRNKGQDLGIMRNRIFSAYNIKKAILIGESAAELSLDQDPTKYEIANSLATAVESARTYAEQLAAGIDNCLTDDTTPHEAVVVMSPGCASFDMFDSYIDRGNQYQTLVKNLK